VHKLRKNHGGRGDDFTGRAVSIKRNKSCAEIMLPAAPDVGRNGPKAAPGRELAGEMCAFVDNNISSRFMFNTLSEIKTR